MTEPRSPVVLLVGLPPPVTEAFVLMLRPFGTSPVMASALAAQRLIGRGVVVDAALCDCTAEAEPGAPTALWLHERHPEVAQVVVCADEAHAHYDIALDCPILRPPFDRRDVHQALLQAGLALPNSSDSAEPRPS